MLKQTHHVAIHRSTLSMSDNPKAAPAPATPAEAVTGQAQEPPASFVKLAMRNMVAKGAKSLKHFALTSMGLLAVLVGLAYLTKP